MTNDTRAYTKAIDSVAAYIKSPSNQRAVGRNDGSAITAFEASTILAIAFDTTKEKVIMDLVMSK